MANYDFNSALSPLDFELLCKDLLEADLNVRLENFREGRDKGIDLRYAPTSGQESIIVQCKRYSSYSSLKSELTRNELPKIIKLQPRRYILATSVSLTVAQVDEVKTILAPFVCSSGDIYGKDRLNSLLQGHEEIERRHIKLWIGSSGVLGSILNAGTHLVSREEAERAIASSKLYVKNPSFGHALDILQEHHVCIISGIPGIGKTTLARMLLLYFYHSEFNVIKIESDISEATRMGQHDKPRFYYYDDFLGQTGKADKLNKNEDQKLLDFMASVRDSKNSRFVLTTREYILNQARITYEKLNRADFDHRICTIDLSDYSRRIRAEILYNHLYFSELPSGHLEALVGNRGYLQIIDHDNYIPRVVETLTTASWVGSLPSDQYLKVFLEKLDNPAEIWDHAFKNQLTEAARFVLAVLTSLPVEVALRDLEDAFISFYQAQHPEHGRVKLENEFNLALKELDGTFLASRRIRNVVLIGFQNPSIRDFMSNLLLGGQYLSEMIRSFVFFEQPQWLAETLTERKLAHRISDSERLMRLASDAMQLLIEARSSTMLIEGTSPHQYVAVRAPRRALRLAVLAAAVQGIETDQDRTFIHRTIAGLAASLEAGQASPSFCLQAVEPLKQFGYLSGAAGLNFIGALKTSSAKDPSDFDDFETLAGVMEAFPDEFSELERENIRETYGGFADQFASECAKGQLDIKDPENIREEASRVDYIGGLLSADTNEAQKILNDYANKREQDEEEERNWDRDDDERRGGGQSTGTDCTDAEIDSMFGTLGK